MTWTGRAPDAVIARIFVVVLLLMTTTVHADGRSPKKLRRVWLGLSGGITTVFHPSGANVCASPEWICAQADGSRYPHAGSLALPANVTAGFGGLASALVATIDFALTDRVLVGIRFGFYVHPADANVVNFGTYFTIGEARVTWVLGPRVTGLGLRPYALFGVGFGDFSAPVETALSVSGLSGSQHVSAWRVAGPGFIDTGLGIRFGDARFAVMFALKVVSAFGSGSATAFMPELAVTAASF